ncbi:dTDP-glucose 4,6-dehydratase [Sphaeroforma arctica JP610]|uniref:dTDP-glucose 4,6-dehydratase n=1 Tax=Sphaeroforma arctica JP610 TaxID=667725 RepID=A0A0L0FKP8_9EUKA|nr:dTDP-glucose 4,6-dehydratase [Sphaeroforma arctica JP610]KNC77359.1 dTDP-glucose 4,6-dehydratase [Sphaeroforma arctica JP610]|eukprot:XP_014151261.1 dTDP-glucose 4,6-dehydratase [Sphaeroforma arctica JP610]
MLGDLEYTPKNIFLTGGAGFIGSHVVEYMVNKYPDYQIICFDCLDYCASTKNFDAVKDNPNFVFVKGDIRNEELVTHVFKTYNVDTVMNFAAQSHVDMSFGNSIEFTKVNVVGTHVLLECARVHKIKRFIHVSTDEVYGEVTTKNGVEESHTLDPTNPYSSSKAAAELIIKAYIKSFNMPIIITRGNNVYGNAQYPEKVIPKFILRLLSGRKCCLHGDGSAKRTYIHVRDVCTGFDTVLHKGQLHEIYNIGTDEDISMLQLAEALVRLTNSRKAGSEGELIECVVDRAFNDCRYFINSQKLIDLGWKPVVDFEKGLAETIEWYRNLDPAYWPEFSHALEAHPPIVKVQDY